MGGRMRKLLICFPVILLLVTACDDSNRFELSKDASGRTIRLDKKTGEIALLEGNQLQALKDPKVQVLNKAKLEELAKPKDWEGLENPNLGVFFNFKTAWRDGEMFYTLDVNDLIRRKLLFDSLFEKDEQLKKKADAKYAAIKPEDVSARLNRAILHIPFTFQLYDENGTMLRQETVSKFVRIVDERGLTTSYKIESSLPLSAELYQQLRRFTVQWR